MSETEGTSIERFEQTLRFLASRTDKYDFVLLDAQAGSDSYAKVSASVAHQVVIVSEFDPISLQGVDRLKIFFSSVMEPSNTWVLYNKILPEFATAIGEGLIIAQILPPIPWDVEVVRAFAQRELAVNMQEPNAYTIALSQIVARLTDDETKAKVKKWLITAEQFKMQPIVSRLDELEGEITNLQREKIANDLRIRKARRAPFFWTGAIVGGIAAAFPVVVREVGTRINELEGLSFREVMFSVPIAFLALSALVIGLVSGVIAEVFRRTGRKEQSFLEADLFIAHRMEDINEERKRLKVTADAIALVDRRSSTSP